MVRNATVRLLPVMIADFGVSVANDLTRIQLIRRDNNNLKVGAYALFNERLKTYVLMSA